MGQRKRSIRLRIALYQMGRLVQTLGESGGGQ